MLVRPFISAFTEAARAGDVKRYRALAKRCPGPVPNAEVFMSMRAAVMENRLGVAAHISSTAPGALDDFSWEMLHVETTRRGHVPMMRWVARHKPQQSLRCHRVMKSVFHNANVYRRHAASRWCVATGRVSVAAGDHPLKWHRRRAATPVPCAAALKAAWISFQLVASRRPAVRRSGRVRFVSSCSLSSEL